jgi:AcrR family transcriptional regulator
MTILPTRFQARGLERRKALTAACRALLARHHVGQFGLAEVAVEAGVPKTSVYHFFARIEDLLAAVAVDVAGELLDWLAQPMDGAFAAWSDVVRALPNAAARFMPKIRLRSKFSWGRLRRRISRTATAKTTFQSGWRCARRSSGTLSCPTWPISTGRSFARSRLPI